MHVAPVSPWRRSIRALAPILTLLAVAGCSLPRVREDKYLHMLCVDEDGGAAALYVEGPTARRESQLVHHTQRVAEAYWDFCIDRCTLPADVPIMLVLHGGLVSMGASIAEASRTIDAIERGEAEADWPRYPIFVNWETGIGTSYVDHLFSVRQGRRASLGYALLTFPFHLVVDVGHALVRLPSRIRGQIEGLDRVYVSNSPQAVPHGWRRSAWIDTRDQFSSGAATALFVAGEFVPGVLRVLTTPVLDAMGVASYRNMIRRARVLFLRDEDFDSGQHHMTGALALLMTNLLRDTPFKRSALDGRIEAIDLQLTAATICPKKRCMLERQREIAVAIRDSNGLDFRNRPFRNPAEPRFQLLAHSMGTIPANELVRRWGKEASFEHIVYMAAACSIRDFADQTLPYVADNDHCHFYNLCLHPLDEIGEWQGWGMLPHGSLLEWIDSFITDHHNELDRTLGKWNNVMRALPIIDYLTGDVRERIHIRGFGRSRGNPRSHGELNDRRFAFWEPRYWDPAEDEWVSERFEAARAADDLIVRNGDQKTERDVNELTRRLEDKLELTETVAEIAAIRKWVRQRLVGIYANRIPNQELERALFDQIEARRGDLTGTNRVKR